MVSKLFLFVGIIFKNVIYLFYLKLYLTRSAEGEPFLLNSDDLSEMQQQSNGTLYEKKNDTISD